MSELKPVSIGEDSIRGIKDQIVIYEKMAREAKNSQDKALYESFIKENKEKLAKLLTEASAQIGSGEKEK